MACQPTLRERDGCHGHLVPWHIRRRIGAAVTGRRLLWATGGSVAEAAMALWYARKGTSADNLGAVRRPAWTEQSTGTFSPTCAMRPPMVHQRSLPRTEQLRGRRRTAQRRSRSGRCCIRRGRTLTRLACWSCRRRRTLELTRRRSELSRVLKSGIRQLCSRGIVSSLAQ